MRRITRIRDSPQRGGVKIGCELVEGWTGTLPQRPRLRGRVGVLEGMRRIAIVLAVLLAALVLAPGAQALPRGFFGIVPQTAIGARDMARMRSGGVETIRTMVSWAAIQQSPRPEYDWGGLDDSVALAAEDHIELLPFLISTPHWLSHDWRRLPVDSGRQRRAWAAF